MPPKPRPPCIMGIDPGTQITGYGVITLIPDISVVDYGSIKPPPKLPLHDRYFIIFNSIETLIQTHQPAAVAIETQFVNKNVQTAIKLGMARGVVIIAAKRHNIPIFEYAPNKAKLAVVGNGKASKLQVQKMMQVILKLPSIPTPEDAADALALAVCHAHTLNDRKSLCLNI